MKQKLALVLSLAAICRAASANLGLSFDKRAGSLPTLKLPYATYQAASYNPNGDVCLTLRTLIFPTHLLNILQIYTFKNIRFGAPPVGDLRWAKPAPPATETEIQNGSYGPICIQTPVKAPKLTGPGASSPIGKAANQFLMGGIPIPFFANTSEGTSKDFWGGGIPIPYFNHASEGMYVPFRVSQ